MSHAARCQAPICKASIQEDGVEDIIWYPGEDVCVLNPLSRAQKAQKKINRYLNKRELKYPDRAFTFKILSEIQRVRSEIKGLGPNRGR